MRRLIVVTGGSRGIGRAIIEKFAVNDFDCVTCSRNEKELLQLRSDLAKSAPDAKLYYSVADLSVRDDIKRFIDDVLNLGRHIHVLVNNAGFFIPGELTTEPEGTLESMINANLFSAYHLTRGLIPKMKTEKSGHVFNMCSIASIKAYANGGSYAVSKFALLGFSKCLREELMTTGIRVTAVMPGATKTRSWEGVDLPDDRFMTIEDVAECIFGAWSLSPRSVVEEILIRPQLGDI